ncbi:site-specific DNA-methyltransferase [Fluviispira vulneris]|uniref:site-specific DNA-methyltransferase n=1 Tax=Fluviispira vulneris TaxID=2763012 RepID=UPI001C943010|nr:site-specific DNA-methyltransferase [Fluviispira vulneris]
MQNKQDIRKSKNIVYNISSQKLTYHLLEDTNLSQNSKDTQNLLIHGDNLDVLKHLQDSFKNTIKCIYLDPPFNTGVSINSKGMKLKYCDEFDHERWIEFMRQRLIACRILLNEEGCLFLHLDDNEFAYAKVLLDNIFGRENYINTITVKTHDPSGFKVTGKVLFSCANYLLLYAKNKNKLKLNPVYLEKEYDKFYSYWLYNREENHSLWKFENIKDAFVKLKFNKSSFKSLIQTTQINKKELEKDIANFAISNPKQVFRLAPIGGGAKLKRNELIEHSKAHKGVVFKSSCESKDDFFLLNGNQIIFYDKRFQYINGKFKPSEILTDIWTDIPWNGIAREGGVSFCNGKKPEALIKRILSIATLENEWVLDCFLGSGTTAAVAHKMQRKWIGIEKEEQIYTHAHTRLCKVIKGNDLHGISRELTWNGGGGFKFLELR